MISASRRGKKTLWIQFAIKLNILNSYSSKYPKKTPLALYAYATKQPLEIWKTWAIRKTCFRLDVKIAASVIPARTAEIWKTFKIVPSATFRLFSCVNPVKLVASIFYRRRATRKVSRKAKLTWALKKFRRNL